MKKTGDQKTINYADGDMVDGPTYRDSVSLGNIVAQFQKFLVPLDENSVQGMEDIKKFLDGIFSLSWNPANGKLLLVFKPLEALAPKLTSWRRLFLQHCKAQSSRTTILHLLQCRCSRLLHFRPHPGNQ